jgi:hypothetical protein
VLHHALGRNHSVAPLGLRTYPKTTPHPALSRKGRGFSARGSPCPLPQGFSARLLLGTRSDFFQGLAPLAIDWSPRWGSYPTPKASNMPDQGNALVSWTPQAREPCKGDTNRAARHYGGLPWPSLCRPYRAVLSGPDRNHRALPWADLLHACGVEGKFHPRENFFLGALGVLGGKKSFPKRISKWLTNAPRN